MIDQYARVELLTNAFQAQGAKRGDIHYVIEVYETGEYDVEFSEANGTRLMLKSPHVPMTCASQSRFPFPQPQWHNNIFQEQ